MDYNDRRIMVMLQLSSRRNQEEPNDQNFPEFCDLYMLNAISTNSSLTSAKNPKVKHTRKITMPLFSICT